MYVDQKLTNAIFLWREYILNEILSDRSVCDIVDDLSFYEGLDVFTAEKAVELVLEGE